MDAEISHVSDTALMVAACRAMETVREDGLVRDPYAARLAGERGMAIARSLKAGTEDSGRLMVLQFGIGIRSYFLDELVRNAVTERGLGTVLCLGAGLDTRPWRLDLPESLRWIEVDFPDMLDYKSAALAGEKPRCRVERMTADLAHAEQRNAAFAAVGREPALLITEGLLTYLAGSVIDAMAAGARGTGLRYWLLDAVSPLFEKAARLQTYTSIENVRAAGHLNGLEILDVLHRNGWLPVERRSYITDAWMVAQERIKKMMPQSQEPPPPPSPEVLADPSGVHMLGRE